MPKGWVKLPRDLLDWEWYSDRDMVRLWVHCLLKVNYKPSRWLGVDVPAGSFPSGRAALARETGLSEQTIRTCLKRLQSTSELTITNHNKFSVFTIKNWDLDHSENVNQPANSPVVNHGLTTLKEGKKERKKNKIKRSVFSIPTLKQVSDYVNEISSSVNPVVFLNHYEANGWMVGKVKMNSWEATIRKWNTNQKENPNGPRKPQQFLTADEKLARATASSLRHLNRNRMLEGLDHPEQFSSQEADRPRLNQRGSAAGNGDGTSPLTLEGPPLQRAPCSLHPGPEGVGEFPGNRTVCQEGVGKDEG